MIDLLGQLLAEYFPASISRVLDGTHGVVGFWVGRINKTAMFAQAALQIVSTTVSSASSERVFSDFKRLVSSTDKDGMHDDNKEDFIFRRSAMKNANRDFSVADGEDDLQ